MNQVHSILGSFDLFGVSIEQSLGQQQKYRSTLSQLISLVLVLFGFSSIVGQITDVFLFQTPQVYMTQTQHELQSILLNNSNFNFQISLADQTPKQQIYYLLMSVCTQGNTSKMNGSQPNIICQDYPMITCQDYGQNSESVLGKQSYCVDPKINLYLNYSHTFIDFKIQTCVNTSTNQDCASKEKIDQFFQYKQVNIGYTDLMIDQANTNSPFKQIQRQYQLEIQDTANLIKTLFSLGIVEAQTLIDPFFFTRVTNYDSAIKIENIQMSNIRPQDNLVLLVRFQLSDIMTTYHRSYENILDALARVFGFLIPVILILRIFLVPYNKQLTYNQVRDDLFGRKSNHIIQIKEHIDSYGKYTRKEEQDKIFEKVQIVNLIKSLMALEKLQRQFRDDILDRHDQMKKGRLSVMLSKDQMGELTSLKLTQRTELEVYPVNVLTSPKVQSINDNIFLTADGQVRLTRAK